MVSIKNHFLSLKVILLTTAKNYERVAALVSTKELLQEYHKAPSGDLSFSIFLLNRISL